MQAKRERREGTRGELAEEKSPELLANVLKWRELVSPHDVFMPSCFFHAFVLRFCCVVIRVLSSVHGGGVRV